MNGAVTRRELLSQPERWQSLIRRMETSDGLPRLELEDYDEIILFGSGSSYYLALLLGYLTEMHTLRLVRVLPSCELFLCEDRYLTPYAGRKRLAIGVSRSGESSEALIAADVLARHGVPLLALGCVEESSLLQKAALSLPIPEGQEDGMVMLRSFTAMVLGFQLLLNGAAPSALDLETLPAAGERLLRNSAEPLKRLANRADFRRFVVLGSGLNYPLALEAALKFQEMAIVTSEAYHSLEYRHGPKSTAAPDTLLVLFAPEGEPDYGVSLICDLKEYGVGTLVIGEEVEPYREVADWVVALESGLDERERLILNLLPVHLLAVETALRLGQNPDAPRNLAPVVRF